MKIGFSTIFSYRPHVQQIFYLSEQLKDTGHEIYFLNCNASLPTCYTLELRPGNRFKECLKCKIGSLYSYTKENTTFIDSNLKETLSPKTLYSLTKSSSFTLTRIEDPKDVNSKEVIDLQKKLHPTVEIVYANAIKWIKDNQLEFVYFFNGRMDATNALKQACFDSKIKFCAVERPLFANGLQFNFNENCLSLRGLNELHSEYIDKPLTEKQALLAASLVTSRFRKTENLEWRNFNKDSINKEWPTEGTGKRILIMPSSRNEVWSEHDWRNEWVEYPQIFEKIIEKIGGDYSNVILRSHPIWSQNLGGRDGAKIVEYYKSWCKEKNIYFIEPESKISSSDLMQQTDFLIINGSSAAYESCILGVPTISAARSRYQFAKLAQVIISEEDLINFNPDKLLQRDKSDQIKFTLRFIYTYFIRYAIFNSNVRAESLYEFSYSPELDIGRLEKMMQTGTLIPDDTNFSTSEESENKIIDLILNKDWNSLECKQDSQKTNLIKVKRRGLYVFVDRIRNQFKRGDL